MSIKEVLFQTAPNGRINCSTKQRKELLLSNDSNFIYHGNLYDIKFNNLGGGVCEAYSEIRKYSVDKSKINNK